MTPTTRWFQHGELHLALLALLRRRPMHGYELMGELGDAIGGDYQPSPGSIYPAVQSLEAEGLISGADDTDRRVYALTTEGHRALERRGARLASLERRLGVRLSDGLEAALSRFAERVRATGADESTVSPVLNAAADEIESMMKRGGT